MPDQLASTGAELSADVCGNRSANCDVVVLGAGPAGAAIARELARKGLSVIVLLRPRRAIPIGETVPPSIVKPLARLGLWEAFLAEQHAQAPGISVVWGGHIPAERNFLFNAYGPGWHLDRGRFDAMLLHAAEAAGVQFLESLTCDCKQRGALDWQFTLKTPKGAMAILTRWVVDATGRSGWLPRHFGIGRTAVDRLIALVKFLPSEGVRETRTLIEACAGGWWYAAALPRGTSVLAYFTDVDLLPRDAPGKKMIFDAEFAQTSLIAAEFTNLDGVGIRSVAAGSTCADCCAGSGWIAIGDAAACYDPLSGQGIMKALGSAIEGAEVVAAGLDGVLALEDFARNCRLRFRRYLEMRADYYGRERRWSGTEFWRRRQLSLVAGALAKAR